jgi:hypothetical protein
MKANDLRRRAGNLRKRRVPERSGDPLEHWRRGEGGGNLRRPPRKQTEVGDGT